MTQVAEHYSESENIKPADFELAGCFFTIIPNLAQNHPNLIWFITLYPVSIWGDHTWFLEQYGMFQVIAILLIR